MPVSERTAYPYGGVAYFETAERSVFNTASQTWEIEVYYTGRVIVLFPYVDPLTGVQEPLPAGTTYTPTYGRQPSPRPIDPPPVEPPGQRVFPVVVRESVSVQAGDYQVYSTGAIHPRRVTGWQNGGAVATSDDAHAFIDTDGGGYSSALVMSDFGFSIPANATIVGLKITVERSKL